eukprot:15482172-Alexandrium_andersonii.AAC.1
MLQRAGEERGENAAVAEARTHGPVSLLCATLQRLSMNIDMSFDISGRGGFDFNLLIVPDQRIVPMCHDCAGRWIIGQELQRRHPNSGD